MSMAREVARERRSYRPGQVVLRARPGQGPGSYPDPVPGTGWRQIDGRWVLLVVDVAAYGRFVWSGR